MLKHGLIADYGYFQSLVSLPEFTPEALTPFILSSVQIKLKITKVDPQEKNYRKALNFGHSIGHALESWSNEAGKTALLHGEAVALGLLAELWLSGQCLGMSPEPEAELKRVLPRLVPDFSFSPSDLDALLWYVFQDKKNVADDIYMALLKNPEETVPAFRVEKEWVSKAFLYLSHYLTTEKKG
jgi:3-dehydroquinate synthase